MLQHCLCKALCWYLGGNLDKIISPSINIHGSHRSWHTFFKDFWGKFSRTFQGLFFVLSNIHSRKTDKQWTFQIRHTETIWSWVRQKNGGGGIWVCVFNFFRWFAILPERGVLGSSPRNFLLELVQNPAILNNSGGYTSLLLCQNRSRDCPFWNRLIHWNT